MTDTPPCFGSINLAHLSPCGRCAMAGMCAENVTASGRWGLILWPRKVAQDVLPDVQACEADVVSEVAQPLLSHGFVVASSREPGWRFGRRRVLSLREAKRGHIVALFHGIAPGTLSMFAGYRDVAHAGDTYRPRRTTNKREDYTLVSAFEPSAVSDLAIQVAEGYWRTMGAA